MIAKMRSSEGLEQEIWNRRVGRAILIFMDVKIKLVAGH